MRKESVSTCCVYTELFPLVSSVETRQLAHRGMLAVDISRHQPDYRGLSESLFGSVHILSKNQAKDWKCKAVVFVFQAGSIYRFLQISAQLQAKEWRLEALQPMSFSLLRQPKISLSIAHILLVDQLCTESSPSTPHLCPDSVRACLQRRELADVQSQNASYWGSSCGRSEWIPSHGFK